jgi:hypothetical protein
MDLVIDGFWLPPSSRLVSEKFNVRTVDEPILWQITRVAEISG